MKHCPYCGKEYPDDVELCVIDRHRLLREGETQAPEPALAEQNRRYAEVSLEERRFWEQATLRHLAILMVRLQCIWFFFNAVLQTIHLARYFILFATNRGFSTPFPRGISTELFWTIFPAIAYAAAGFALLLYAEQILNWFIRDWVWKRVSDIP
jgi:hypothetical protein